MSDVRIPDRVGEPIRGFRMWRLASSRLRHRRYAPPVPNPDFGSLLPFCDIDQIWQGRQRLVARCAARDANGKFFEHESPDPACRCGIYAVKRLDWVEEPLLLLLADRLRDHAGCARRRPASGRPHENWLVVGSVSLWGKIVEGTWGYRAQYAYPEQLWLLPPARIGGGDKSAIEEATAVHAHDLLVVLRHRYRVPVGYADQDTEVSKLLGLDELGWFFSWRLAASGADRLGRILRTIGRPTADLPTVRDALKLWLASRGGGSWDDHLLVERYLAPTFGHVPADRPELVDAIPYAPVSRASKLPYKPRTVVRHRRAVEKALALAAERWLPST